MIDVEPLERHWSERQWRGIIVAPRQRNTDVEKADLKAGRIPEDWAANPAKLHQKDRDGRWTLKRGRRKRKPDGTPMMEIATPVYGYKSHVGVDRRHRFIRTWSVTDAARHDGRELPGLLDRSQHRIVRLGRHRVSIREERKAHRQGRTGLEGPLPQAARQADARAEDSAPTPPARGSGPASSMSSPTRSTAWGCSSAPSASPERAPKSASPTSPATCAGFCSGRQRPRQNDAKAPDHDLRTPKALARDKGSVASRQSSVHANRLRRMIEVSKRSATKPGISARI